LASVVLDCALPASGDNDARVQLLGVEFFDDECLVVAGHMLSPEGKSPRAFEAAVKSHDCPLTGWLEHGIVAAVDYSNQPFEVIHEGENLNDFSREGLAWEAMERWRVGKVCRSVKIRGGVGVDNTLCKFAGSKMEVKKACAVEACKGKSVSLSVNGRLGRRVACVLDLEGSVLEVLDLDVEQENDGEEETPDDAEE
jgi:hypothetical protein